MSACINCKNQNLIKIIKIGSQPLSGIFLNKIIKKPKKYSLDLFQCSKCKLVQIGKIIKAQKMFGDTYEYRTSLSKFMSQHINKKAKTLIKKRYVKKNSSILDIGSNDGTFLNNFKHNQLLIGIDPSAKKFSNFYNKNIKTIFEYFSKENLNKFFKRSYKFDVISSFAMFYDISNPNKFCKDIKESLNKNGIWILEFSYLPLMLKNLTYDQICHEHVAYYSLNTFKKIAEKNRLKVIDLSFNEINGGSIEIICAKKGSNHKVNSNKILKTLSEEKKINMKSFENFNKRINDLKYLLQYFLNLKSKKSIIAYGASTKGNVVLNHCNVNKSQIREICDGSSRKLSKFTPGTNLKIISKELMRKKNPDYLLVLIWSFRQEVINQEINYLKKGGKLIFLLPRFHIVNKDNYKNYLNSNFSNLSYNY